jgi:acyl-CoA thioester hydrolase
MARPSPELLDGARYPFSYELGTRYADLDPNNHVNNVAMVAAFEDARARFDFSLGFREAMGDRTAMIVSNAVDYLGQAHFPDPIRMFVGVLDTGRTSWTLASVAIQGETVCAFARATMVCVVDGKASPLPDAFRAALETKRLPTVTG